MLARDARWMTTCVRAAAVRTSTSIGPRALLGAGQRLHRLGRQLIQMGGERNEDLGSRESVAERVMLMVNGKFQASRELIERVRRGWLVSFQCQ